MRRLLAGIAVVASLHACVQLATRPSEDAALVPAADGAITDLAVQFHAPASDVFLPVFGELLSSLHPSTTVHVVLGEEADRALFDTIVPADLHVEYTVAGRPITSWMRDRLAVLDDGTILAPNAPMPGPDARVHDWTVPWTLAEHLDAPILQTDFRFEGGDLIADDERVYVARPLLDRNPGSAWGDLDLTRFGRSVVALDPAPDHHIGMFLTPLGDGVVLVGDPSVVPDELVPDTVGGLPFAEDEALGPQFTAVVEQLEDEGLEVVRMPLVPSTTQWVWVSYNNALVERRDGQLHVFLPTYDIALDDVAIDIWEDQGAVVHPIDVSTLFRLGGSVRCLTAPITRK